MLGNYSVLGNRWQHGGFSCPTDHRKWTGDTPELCLQKGLWRFYLYGGTSGFEDWFVCWILSGRCGSEKANRRCGRTCAILNLPEWEMICGTCCICEASPVISVRNISINFMPMAILHKWIDWDQICIKFDVFFGRLLDPWFIVDAIWNRFMNQTCWAICDWNVPWSNSRCIWVSLK